MEVQQLQQKQDMEFQAAETHRHWERAQMEEMRRRQEGSMWRICMHGGRHYVQFNLQGKAHTVTEFELAEHMHFEPDGNVTDLFVADNLWKLVTGRTLGKNTTKLSSHLQHPTIRFIQRALSFSIFAKGESGARVTKEEMALLTQMLQPIGTERLNLPFLMMEHWMAAAKNKKMGAGQYTLGGYITYLAKCLGHKSFRMKKSGGPTTLDIKMLDEMKHVKKVGRNYFWVYDARMFDLPFEKKLDLNDLKTFILVARGGTMLHHDGEQLRQRHIEEGRAHLMPLNKEALQALFSHKEAINLSSMRSEICSMTSIMHNGERSNTSPM